MLVLTRVSRVMRPCNNCDGNVEVERVELLDSHLCSRCAKQHGPKRVRGDMDEAGEVAVVRGEVYGSYRTLSHIMSDDATASKTISDIIS